MDIVIIPFHDWRKSEHEGFRTRDVHFIQALAKNEDVNKILVVNRPLTWLELLYKKHKKALNGKQVFRKGKFTLTQVGDNIFVADYHSKDIIGQLSKKYLWFIQKYSDREYADFVMECCDRLGMKTPCLISQNIFAFKLAADIKTNNKVFDAWDNFLKFPLYQDFAHLLEEGYKVMAEQIPNWITNSNENIGFYKKRFNVESIDLVKNGVKSSFASGNHEVPDDIKNIKRPIVGFGGKISYLMDYDLINFLTKENPDISFVFVGQILDKNIFGKIVKRKNVHFLGDKKYDVYPNYVKSFDICIVPYNINEGQHGGDSMKAYEYLLLQKKVVGTNGNGLEDLGEYIYVAHDKNEFSEAISSMENNKKYLRIEEHSWQAKTTKILSILKQHG